MAVGVLSKRVQLIIAEEAAAAAQATADAALQYANANKSKVVFATRDMAAASGDVAYVNAGFPPKSVRIMASIPSSRCKSEGVYDGLSHSCLIYGTSAGYDSLSQTTVVVLYDPASGAHYQLATVSSLDSDGCTLTWLKGGAPASAMASLCFIFER